MTKVFPFVAFLFTLATVTCAQSVETTSSSATPSSNGTDCIPMYCQCGGQGWVNTGQYPGCLSCAPETACTVLNTCNEFIPRTKSFCCADVRDQTTGFVWNRSREQEIITRGRRVLRPSEWYNLYGSSTLEGGLCFAIAEDVELEPIFPGFWPGIQRYSGRGLRDIGGRKAMIITCIMMTMGARTYLRDTGKGLG
ncbi:hypothetical protein K438DRAFT_1776927 [Mycena galopus ATCC 62051]|nr:hypothetical protein K438DRAFT_1776927 [Mycena galopus ATCC 62051]